MPRPTGQNSPFFDALALFRAGKLDKADRRLKQIIAADPNQVDAMHLRAMVAMQRNQIAMAIGIMRKALKIRPFDTALLVNLGNMLMAAGERDEALKRFLAVIEIDPNQMQARSGAAAILLEQGRFFSAEPHLRHALKQAPRDIELLTNLAQVLLGQARAREAAEIADNAIALAPNAPLAHVALAEALSQLQDFDGAVAAHRQAMALSDDQPSFWFGLVVSLTSFGRLAEAEQECRALIAAHPDFAPAYVRLSNLAPEISDDEIAAMRRLAKNAAVSERDTIQLEFALGAAFEQRGAYEEAFGFYQKANRRTRKDSSYSQDKMAAGFAEIRSAFSPQALATHQGEGCPDPTPIFVVGMPRSGTTLVEQILSSHPQVVGANELEVIPRLYGEFVRTIGSRSPEEALASMDGSRLRKLGESYIEELRAFSPDARHIVDKLPGNFPFLGFIALILPEAKIVHCRRDPLDTCISIYKTRFVRGSVDYGYDFDDLGHYFRLYEEQMRYWNEVLPKKPVEIVYEDLVANQRSESERLLNELGLDWAESCERFYETKRSVLTASVVQVRQPIYTSSIGRAKRFGTAFDPLRAAIAGTTGSGASA